jgi:hypothetical protein
MRKFKVGDKVKYIDSLASGSDLVPFGSVHTVSGIKENQKTCDCVYLEGCGEAYWYESRFVLVEPACHEYYAAYFNETRIATFSTFDCLQEWVTERVKKGTFDNIKIIKCIETPIDVSVKIDIIIGGEK